MSTRYFNSKLENFLCLNKVRIFFRRPFSRTNWQEGNYNSYYQALYMEESKTTTFQKINFNFFVYFWHGRLFFIPRCHAFLSRSVTLKLCQSISNVFNNNESKKEEGKPNCKNFFNISFANVCCIEWNSSFLNSSHILKKCLLET